LTNEIRLVLDTSKIKGDINKGVIDIEKREKIIISYSIFSMVSDAFKKQAKIYKIKKDMQKIDNIPSFKLE